MKRILLILSVFLTSTAYADCASDLGVAFPFSQSTALCTKYGPSQATSIIPQAGATIFIGSVGSPVAGIYSKGVLNAGVFVPTLAATPVEGTNSLAKGQFNAIPTNAANNVGLLAPVPAVGDRYFGLNNSGASQRIKAAGTPGINGAAAGTYAIITTGSYFDCTATSATNYSCSMASQVLTPAGP